MAWPTPPRHRRATVDASRKRRPGDAAPHGRRRAGREAAAQPVRDLQAVAAEGRLVVVVDFEISKRRRHGRARDHDPRRRIKKLELVLVAGVCLSYHFAVDPRDALLRALLRVEAGPGADLGGAAAR